MRPPPAITLDRVTLRHGASDIVRDLTGVFAPGSSTALVGPNGAGKTTLLRALTGMHGLASGKIHRGGLAPADIALLPQGSQLDRSFPLTCRDVVALGLSGRIGPFRSMAREQLRAVDLALDSLGVADLATRPVGALSAGQFQRVLFARLMIQDASVLLLDEPFTAVDTGTRDQLLDILRLWHSEGRTIVTVLHDIELAREMFPQTLLLSDRSVTWGSSAVVLSEGNGPRTGWTDRSWDLPRQDAA